jgi:hypothetical protein
MLTINIYNNGTGEKDTGNYDWEALVNHTLIDSGRIESHRRKRGWKALIGRISEPSLDEILAIIEAKRRKVMKDSNDPSWTEHFAELQSEIRATWEN